MADDDKVKKSEEKKEEEKPKKEGDDTKMEDAPDNSKKDEKADDDKSKKRKSREEPEATPSRAGKRERKAATAFAPAETFRQKPDTRLQLVEGRGSKLGDSAEMKEAIESVSGNSQELASAFKLLFSARGKFTTAAMKSYLLDFNGYLPVFPDDATEERRSKIEEDAEAKVSKKAYKLKIQEIKMLCDFFHVDRSGITTKEELIDRLLDYLGEINEEMLKSAKKPVAKKPVAKKPAAKKKAAKKKKTKSKTKAEEEPDEEEEEEEVEEEEPDEEDEDEGENGKDDKEGKDKDGKPSMPNDGSLRRWVKAYITCYNMDKATIKHAIETASDKYGMDLSDKKQKIKQMLTEEM